MGLSNQTSAELVSENILYAKKLARRFYNKRAHTQAELADLESAAFVGLCEAANRYDDRMENKFQTYSYLRIVGSMYDYLSNNGGFSRSSYKMLEGVKSSKNKASLSVARDLRELLRFQTLIEDWGVKIQVNVKKGSVDLLYSNQKLLDDQLVDSELQSKLHLALSMIDPITSSFLKARYFEGKKLIEIAEENPSYSKSHISRVCTKGLVDLRKKLRILFQEGNCGRQMTSRVSGMNTSCLSFAE